MSRARVPLRTPGPRGGLVAGGALVLVWLLCAVLGPALVGQDPRRADILNQLLAPSGEHWFGTDALGRDVFSRVVVGARDILSISVSAAVLATAAGTLVGALIGYAGGWVDHVVSRVIEAVVSIPGLILALLILAAVGPSSVSLILVVAFGDLWVVARTVRAAVRRIRALDYVDAALIRGERPLAVLVREIVPNILPIVVVELTTRTAYAVFGVASLSFLGFGMQPPSPDWGLQVADSYVLLGAGYWWPTLFPALAIMSLVVGIYLLSSGLTDGLVRRRPGRTAPDPAPTT